MPGALLHQLGAQTHQEVSCNSEPPVAGNSKLPAFAALGLPERVVREGGGEKRMNRPFTGLPYSLDGEIATTWSPER